MQDCGRANLQTTDVTKVTRGARDVRPFMCIIARVSAAWAFAKCSLVRVWPAAAVLLMPNTVRTVGDILALPEWPADQLRLVVERWQPDIER